MEVQEMNRSRICGWLVPVFILIFLAFTGSVTTDTYEITINPVGDHAVGDMIDITGTTNFPVNTTLWVSAGPRTFTNYEPNYFDGQTQVMPGTESNLWSIAMNTSAFSSDEYTIRVEPVNENPVFVFAQFNVTSEHTGTSLPTLQETPHYLYDPKTGALIGYGTTPSPEEQVIINQIRGPGYSPFPAPTPLAMDMAPEQPVYAYGEPVKINITLANAISDTFTFPDFPPDIKISTRKEGWNRGIVRTIRHGDEMRFLQPNNTTSTILIWDQKNDQQAQVNPGVYYLSAQAGVVQNVTPDSTTITSSFISANSEVIVQYPKGALAGTLYPNVSRTDGDITAKLDSLVLNERGGFVNMTVIAPAPGKGSPAAPGFSQVTAEYWIDNSTTQDFRMHSSLYSGNGVSYVTWHTAPIPCDAREIHIAATKFDPYRGHWNFTVDCSDISYCAVENDTLFSREATVDAFRKNKPETTQPASLPIDLVIAALAGTGLIVAQRRPEK